MEARLPLVVPLVLVIAVLVGGCGGDEDKPGPSSAEESSSTSDSADVIAKSSENVDIGGRSLYLKCWGEPVADEPTVLLISGQGPPLSYWEPMANGFAGEGHHLCAYDRAGVGGSDFAPEPRRTTDDQVTELVALLDAVDLEEPLVVVAHSLGSLPALGLVDAAPERVAGVVLVDPWAPRVSGITRAALPPETPNESADLAEERLFLTEKMFDPFQNAEHLVLATCDEIAISQLDEPGPVFGDIPVIVLQAPLPERPAGIPRDYDAVARKAWVDANLEFAAESTRGKVVEVEDTGHDIHVDQPGVVMDAIREVMAG
jgi:pimeloyl-ACP methyl ester carboxylesterase